MSRACSVSTGRAFGVRRICHEWGIARSTFYARRHRQPQRRCQPQQRRGPAPALGDGQLLHAIRETIEQSPFTGEGHRKVWARLRRRGIRTSRKRVLRLMREHNLLAPSRAHRDRGPDVHDGTIVTERPNDMWGTDATTVWLPDDGAVTVFAVVDHFNSECLGLHAAKPATRFEALEPIRQALRRALGGFAADIGAAWGLALRHDHGSQFVSEDFRNEVKFLGIEPSPAFVYAPEGNGVIERFFRTLKEQLLWCHDCRNIDELNEALQHWRERYNNDWLIERHGHKSPAEVRAQYEQPLAAVA